MKTLLRTILLVKKSSSELSDSDPSSALISWPAKREKNSNIQMKESQRDINVGSKASLKQSIMVHFPLM